MPSIMAGVATEAVATAADMVVVTEVAIVPGLEEVTEAAMGPAPFVGELTRPHDTQRLRDIQRLQELTPIEGTPALIPALPRELAIIKGLALRMFIKRLLLALSLLSLFQPAVRIL